MMTMNYRLVSFQIILVMVFSFVGVSAQNQITTNFNLFDPITGKPLIFLPGTNTVQQNVTLPSTLPTVGQTLAVTAVAGNNITTEWVSPASTIAKSNFKVQKTDETNTSDVTFENVDDLFVPVAINKVYELNTVIRFYSSSAAADIQVNFSVPAGTTIAWYYNRIFPAGSEDNGGYTEATNLRFDTDVAPTQRIYELRGIVITGGTAGNVQLRFRRENGAGGDVITLLKNSILRFTTN